MAKRGGKSKRSIWKFYPERDLPRIKKLFFTLLDALTLISFTAAIFYTLKEDYTKTILFMSIGSLLLLFFIVRGIIKSTSRLGLFSK